MGLPSQSAEIRRISWPCYLRASLMEARLALSCGNKHVGAGECISGALRSEESPWALIWADFNSGFVNMDV